MLIPGQSLDEIVQIVSQKSVGTRRLRQRRAVGQRLRADKDCFAPGAINCYLVELRERQPYHTSKVTLSMKLSGWK